MYHSSYFSKRKSTLFIWKSWPFSLFLSEGAFLNLNNLFLFSIAENEKAILEEKKQDEKFNEIIVSCRSLSHYEGRTLKTLLPQVRTLFYFNRLY